MMTLVFWSIYFLSEIPLNAFFSYSSCLHPLLLGFSISSYLSTHPPDNETEVNGSWAEDTLGEPDDGTW
jgi:hypothetical protein